MSATISPALVAEARLRGDRSQQVFDTLLRTLAQPGTIHRLPALATEVAPPAWLALALADVDVAVAVVGPEAAATAELVTRATDAPIVDVADAAIVIETAAEAPAGAAAPAPSRGRPVGSLDAIPVGTALAPEDGARLGLPVDALLAVDDGIDDVGPTDGSGSDLVAIDLEGPGVDGRLRILVGGIDPADLARLGNAADRFPTGFDTWLFGPDGEVVAISRSTTVCLVDPDPTDRPTDTTDHPEKQERS